MNLPVQRLRGCSLGTESFKLLDKDGAVVESMASAVSVVFGDTLTISLSEPCGYKSYDTFTLLYFYLHKHLEPPAYLESSLKLAAALSKPLVTVSILDRKDLLDYIDGKSESCAGLIQMEMDLDISDQSLSVQPLTPSKRARLLNVASISVSDKEFCDFAKKRERVLRTSNVILMSKTGRGFESVRQMASAAIKASKKEAAQGKKSSPVKVQDKNKIAVDKILPLIVIPSAVQSLVTLYNVKDLLENQKFVPSDQYRNQGMDKPASVVIERDPSKTAAGLPLKYEVVDSVDKLKAADWYGLQG